MGLEDSDLLDEGGKASAVSCSICLEAVTDNGARSWAKLQCGHEFHLDCIGSAFNSKGAMQCPNCRKVEKGQWLYAGGYRPLPEFSMDDWAHDEDLYDLSYSEMSFGVHWCPFSGLTRLHSSFDEGEFSSNAYHDLLGQHAIFAEHAGVSSTTHHCPYVAYLGPIHPSSSNSSGNVADGSSFNSQWNGPSVPSEMPPSYGFPSMDVNYHSWDHHSSPFPPLSSRVGGADQPSVPSVTHRPARPNSEVQRSGSFIHPFLVGHSSAARVGSSISSSMIPPYPGSAARARDRVQALQAYFQQPTNSPAVRNAPLISGTRRSSSSHRGMAQVSPVPPVASSSDSTNGFYFFPSASSGRNFQESENPPSNRFHAWERDHSTSFSSNQADRDPVWGPFHQAGGGSDTGATRPTGFRQRYGSERMPSQNRS
ncbi:E3 ubiquitin-protein ligase RFI2 [Rhododendron vialii]|uniref:E3 ubiquitin-protein ligase RFI2 n=1 Tax=Rhododendron vialii TaxID=182163 RepID=UPI00265F5B7F|nr:E3 ubiquitin-protein ligase RFI2 [Rhododendron vialii]